MSATTPRPLPESPLVPSRWPTKAFTLIPMLSFVVLLGAAVLGGVGLALIVVRLDPGSRAAIQSQNGSMTPGILIGQLLSYLPILAAVIYGLPGVASRSLRELGLAWPTRNQLFYGIGGALLMFVAVSAATAIQYTQLRVESHEKIVDLIASMRNPGLIAGTVVLACIVAPVVEELIFRGFLFNALLRVTSLIRVKPGLMLPSSPVLAFLIAAVVSAVVFAAAHGSLTALFPLACGGFVLALIYYRSGSLVSSMITHALFNALNLVVVLSTHSTGG